MAGIVYEIDPTSEDSSNANLVIVDNSTYFLIGDDCPPPAPRTTWVESVDTEGQLPVESKYDNRAVTVALRVVASTDALLETAVNNVQKKVAKLTAEGGTLKKTLPSGDTLVFDVFEASVSATMDRGFTTSKRTNLQVVFTCAPFARGAVVTKTLRSESTLPALVFTETGIGGDVPALGKLVVNEAQAVDQWWVIWGQQSRYYDAASSAALFYEAEGRTAMGGSATAAGPSGASGAGSNVMRNTALGTAYQAILSTQATAAGAHLSHVGDFRVFARVQTPTTNTGDVTVALEWAEGDFRSWTRNSAVSVDRFDGGAWRLLDLGQVSLTKVPQGTQRWEGRIVAAAEIVGDDIDVDWLMLVPITEGSGEVSGVSVPSTPTAFTARDEFNQTVGALTGKTLPVGGTWANGSSGLTDFQASGSGTATYAGSGDSASSTGGRIAIAGTSTLTNVEASLDLNGDMFLFDSAGLILRHVDASNFLFLGAVSTTHFYIQKVIAGVGTIIATMFLPTNTDPRVMDGTGWRRLHARVDSGGRAWLWLASSQSDALLTPILSTQDSALATGGTLASGKMGFRAQNRTATTPTISFDNFWAASFSPDAALFASQSLEVRHDRVIREDSGGTLWPKASSYEGDYLLVPPAGKEARTLRMIVKASRGEPSSIPDGGIDDISAQLTVTPRYLVLPE